jgi:UDP-N-acetylglucosamine--N-acetylmuramyl-(pentapeptide) pyrophosphoryl-undecaprenol N-acetylglucosamine transferase
MVCRAGATTLAELAIVGRPAVLIPFPWATHNHQELNAREFEERGAALCRVQDGLDGPALGRLVLDLADDAARREHMAAAMHRLGRPEAAAEIVDGLERLANGKVNR